ncbi:hypothetical protein EVAR_50520_1 [Eumeta japonica]|uniref:Uncharacterized protein n=1 Tax=Eumeta variegata TaxID=151549 RepID=A0A4C1X6S2_EUMVA|nr:hypothetical protein EVAR_50520_1 [Eumeta japonica]
METWSCEIYARCLRDWAIDTRALWIPFLIVQYSDQEAAILVIVNANEKKKPDKCKQGSHSQGLKGRFTFEPGGTGFDFDHRRIVQRVFNSKVNLNHSFRSPENNSKPSVPNFVTTLEEGDKKPIELPRTRVRRVCPTFTDQKTPEATYWMAVVRIPNKLGLGGLRLSRPIDRIDIGTDTAILIATRPGAKNRTSLVIETETRNANRGHRFSPSAIQSTITNIIYGFVYYQQLATCVLNVTIKEHDTSGIIKAKKHQFTVPIFFLNFSYYSEALSVASAQPGGGHKSRPAAVAAPRAIVNCNNNDVSWERLHAVNYETYTYV